MGKHQQHQDAIERVRAALDQRRERETLMDIATGANVPYGWLQQFAYENITEPGFSKFVALATYLGFKPEDLVDE